MNGKYGWKIILLCDITKLIVRINWPQPIIELTNHVMSVNRGTSEELAGAN